MLSGPALRKVSSMSSLSYSLPCQYLLSRERAVVVICEEGVPNSRALWFDLLDPRLLPHPIRDTREDFGQPVKGDGLGYALVLAFPEPYFHGAVGEVRVDLPGDLVWLEQLLSQFPRPSGR